jgi:ribokinase
LLMRFGVTGEVSRDRLSQPGMGTWEGLGGCAVYLALSLGRLGAEVTFATVIGDDLDAAWLEPLDGAGVKVRSRQLPGSTARLDLAYDHKGDIARLRFEAGVESGMDTKHLPDDFWSADWIVVGTAPRRYQAAVIAHANELGRAVSLSTQREFERGWESLAGLLPQLDVLFINSGEVVGLRGDRLPRGLDALWAVNPNLTCAVTCGGRGALLLHDDRLYQVAACPAQIINTTGAGDAFGATWLFTFTHSGDAAYALRAASAAAALALRGPVHTTLPDWAQIEEKLQACGEHLTVECWPITSSGARAALVAEDAYCHQDVDREVTRS